MITEMKTMLRNLFKLTGVASQPQAHMQKHLYRPPKCYRLMWPPMLLIVVFSTGKKSIHYL